MPIKPKKSQPAGGIQERDMFETPDYGTDLIVPFLQRHPKTRIRHIWECAAGSGRMAARLRCHSFNVKETDLQRHGIDFLTTSPDPEVDAIVTNPPYSLKRQFYERLTDKTIWNWPIPWALLIPADFSQWILRAIQNRCQLVIPTRRIDYITPTGKSGLASNAQFHSFWLCGNMYLPEQLTIVELPLWAKKSLQNTHQEQAPA